MEPVTVKHTAFDISATLPPARAPSLIDWLRAFDWFCLLLAVAVLIDLSGPFLSWKHVMPGPVRWLSHVAIALMIVIIYLRMMVYNHVPGVVWLVGWVSVTWVLVSFLRGQGTLATAWGWWILFQFPMVALFVYLQPHWPERFPHYFHRLYLTVMIGQVLLQLGQWATGQPPGDHLAGFLGRFGSTGLAILIGLMLSFALGRWLATGKWGTLLLMLPLASIASTLAEIKAFLIILICVGMIAVVIFAVRTGQLWKLIPYTIVMVLVLFGFIQLYNTFVPAAERVPIEEYIQDPTKTQNYLDRTERQIRDGRYTYSIGRNYALQLGWESISREPVTMLFGFGLGARGRSSALGATGQALSESDMGFSAGSSLLVLMQEMGVLGLSILAAFMIWVVLTLFGHVRQYPQSAANEIRFGLIVFSLLWPLWLWYGLTWAFRLPMIIYWFALGYVMYEAMQNRRQAQRQAAADVSSLYPERTVSYAAEPDGGP